MEVIPMNAALGAEVRCGDVRKLDDSGIKALRQAWLDNLVVLVRGQEIVRQMDRAQAEVRLLHRRTADRAGLGRVGAQHDALLGCEQRRIAEDAARLARMLRQIGRAHV